MTLTIGEHDIETALYVDVNTHAERGHEDVGLIIKGHIVIASIPHSPSSEAVKNLEGDPKPKEEETIAHEE